MKDWFKYEFGYVNIDFENLYLTNSGNWSETLDLTEKTKEVTSKNNSKSSKVLGFMIIIVFISVFLLHKSSINGKTGLTIIAIIVGGGFKVYQYLKTEIGSKFKIPLEKITEIKLNENNIEITFNNGEDVNDSYKLIGVGEKGKNLMSSLKDKLHTSILHESTHLNLTNNSNFST